jgi:hypothetical protein
VKKVLSFVFVLLFSFSALAANVTFNTNTLKYHRPDCKWAIKCTKNCIETTPEKAKASGGVPCKVCGGR